MAKKESFKDKAKKRAGGAVRRLDKGETAEVRFLFEMEGGEDGGWNTLVSYFDEDEQRSKFYEDEDDVPDGEVGKETYFGLAYDVNKKSVDVWELRKTLVLNLIEYEEEYKTITDRNYKLKRRGEGFKTKYTATPMDSSPLTKRMQKARDEAEGKLAEALSTLLSYTD